MFIQKEKDKENTMILLGLVIPVKRYAVHIILQSIPSNRFKGHNLTFALFLMSQKVIFPDFVITIWTFCVLDAFMKFSNMFSIQNHG